MAPIDFDERARQLRESRLRAKANRMGYSLRKSRRAISGDNAGEFMIVDIQTNSIVRGEKFDHTLDDVEEYLKGD